MRATTSSTITTPSSTCTTISSTASSNSDRHERQQFSSYYQHERISERRVWTVGKGQPLTLEVLVDCLDVLDTMITNDPKVTSVIRRVKWNGVDDNKRACSITGKELIRYLLRMGFVKTKTEACVIGEYLIRINGIIPNFRIQSSKNLFSSSALSNEYILRGMTLLSTKGLNNLIIIPKSTYQSRYLIDILLDINVFFKQLCNTTVSVDGYLINYKSIQGSLAFRKLLLLLSELVDCKLGTFHELHHSVQLCCWLNLYNLLIIHSVLSFQYPSFQNTSAKDRFKLFNDASYTIAGTTYNSVQLRDIILRCKSESKSKSKLTVQYLDPRIHFVLNYGAISSPPLISFPYAPSPIMSTCANSTAPTILTDPDDTEKEKEREQLAGIEVHMNKVTRDFIATNVKVDEVKKVVQLHRIFKWFRNDFLPAAPTESNMSRVNLDSDEELLIWIAKHASDAQNIRLIRALGSSFKITYDLYDWSDNGQFVNNSSKATNRNMEAYDKYFAQFA